jgi:hypothetical protein
MAPVLTKKAARQLDAEITAFLADFKRGDGAQTPAIYYQRATPTDEGQRWHVKLRGRYVLVEIAGPGRRANAWNYTVLEGADQGRMGTSSVFYTPKA